MSKQKLQGTVEKVEPDIRPHVEWLLEHMPVRDTSQVNEEFIIEHATIAYEAWRGAPWKGVVSESIFRDYILPYASVDERRESWRESFREMFLPVVEGITNPAEACVKLNRTIFDMIGVKYSTQRSKANQSAYESIACGLASCTGLSVILINACRAVGVPARFVGTPLWADNAGNHSWVEVFDGERWRYTGAAEPTDDRLDEGWFADKATAAIREDPRYAIYAVTWKSSSLHFPMVWSPQDSSVRAVNVTDRYTTMCQGGDVEKEPSAT